MRRQRKKRKFNLFSAIFLEVASILGIVAIAQPNLVVDWFGAQQSVTMPSRQADGSSSQVSPGSEADSDTLPSTDAMAPTPSPPVSNPLGRENTIVDANANRSAHRLLAPQIPPPGSGYSTSNRYVSPGVYPTPSLNAERRVPAELASHRGYATHLNGRTPKAEHLTFPPLAELRGRLPASRFERNYQQLPVFP